MRIVKNFETYAMAGAAPLLLHTFLCSTALAVSGYALYVKHSNENDEDFEALCDINPHMSCSTVLTSRYSKGFGVIGDLLGEEHPLNVNNSIYGISFYLGIAVLGCVGSRLSLLLAIVGELIGVANFIYLAYIMRYILNDVCLVCLALYAVHFMLLALHTYQYRSSKNSEHVIQKHKKSA